MDNNLEHLSNSVACAGEFIEDATIRLDEVNLKLEDFSIQINKLNQTIQLQNESLSKMYDIICQNTDDQVTLKGLLRETQQEIKLLKHKIEDFTIPKGSDGNEQVGDEIRQLEKLKYSCCGQVETSQPYNLPGPTVTTSPMELHNLKQKLDTSVKSSCGLFDVPNPSSNLSPSRDVDDNKNAPNLRLSPQHKKAASRQIWVDKKTTLETLNQHLSQ
jgi:chromosome segregation ATPase